MYVQLREGPHQLKVGDKDFQYWVVERENGPKFISFTFHDYEIVFVIPRVSLSVFWW